MEKSDLHYGVANGDDLTYLFPVLQVLPCSHTVTTNPQGLFRPLNNEDLKFSHRLIQLLATFATDGKPRIAMGEVAHIT